MLTIHPVDVAIIIAYLVGMIAVGIAVSRRVKGFADFFVAGRSLTTPILICTIVSSYYGLDVLFGDSGDASREGVSVYFVYMRPYTIAMLVAAFWIASRFRDAEFLSLPDILAKHYGRPAQLAGATASFFYALPIMAIMGMAALGHVLFGLPLWLGAAIGGVISVAYTSVGGFWADAVTDAVQFVIMCISLAIALFFALDAVGGFAGVEAGIGEEAFDPLGTAPPLYTLAYALTALSVLVEPQFYQRIFAARDRRTIRNAFLWGMLIWAAYDWAVTALGLVGGALKASGDLPAELPADQVLLRVTLLYLPVGLSGFFLGGCLATAMSTMDSYLLIASGNLVYDIYRPLARTKPDDRQLIRYSRISMALSALACFIIGMYFDRIKEAWAFMASILTSTVLVPILGALFSSAPKKPLAGTLSSAGGLAAVILFYVVLGIWGVENEELETMQVTVFGIEILREYALYFALPVSAAGFAAGSIFGRRP